MTTDSFCRCDFSLPRLVIEGEEQKVLRAHEEFLKRWDEFCLTHAQFDSWMPDWDEEALKAHFERLRLHRRALYFTNPEVYEKDEVALISRPHFIHSQTLRQLHRYRSFKCISFDYNLASEHYNASLINLNGCRFLACDAPQEETLEPFFDLLARYKVTHLVRLTPAIENQEERCFPYWQLKKEGGDTIPYFAVDDWGDRQGIDASRLLSLVMAVRNSHSSAPPMIAVHCFGGVGRTGTFIAAYALIDALERQIAKGALDISVEKVVWQLSLQRPYMVATALQYLTLHQIVKNYLCEVRKRCAMEANSS